MSKDLDEKEEKARHYDNREQAEKAMDELQKVHEGVLSPSAEADLDEAKGALRDFRDEEHDRADTTADDS